MRKSLLGLAALAAAGLVMASPPAHAQQQSDAPAPPRPYTAIAVRLPTPSTDASYTAFRQQLAETARRKDRQALQQLLVTQNFFWQSADGERTDTKKSAIDNFSTAIGLDAKDGSGWDWLAAAAEDPTLEAVPDLKGVSCAPAGPAFDDKAFETVVNATGTDEGEWVATAAPRSDIRGAAKADAPVVDTVATILIRMLPDDEAASGSSGQPAGGDVPFVKVVTPAGKVGYIAADALMPLDFDQICYLKDGAGWKITGYVGDAPQ